MDVQIGPTEINSLRKNKKWRVSLQKKKMEEEWVLVDQRSSIAPGTSHAPLEFIDVKSHVQKSSMMTALKMMHGGMGFWFH